MIYCRDCKYFDTQDFDSGFCSLMDKYISIFKPRYEVFCNDYCSKAVFDYTIKRENTDEILGEENE